MKNLIAIKNTNEVEEKILITDKNQFSWMKMSETYGKYGQLNDRDDAGDGITILSKYAADVANISAKEQEEDEEYCKGDYYACFETNDAIIDAILELEENVDYEYCADLVLAYNYWDGNNWASIILESHTFDSGWEILDNSDDIIKEYDKKEFYKEYSGLRAYKSDNYTFCVSQFSSSWEDAFIEE